MPKGRYGTFDEQRPKGLRRRTLSGGSEWWRIESQDADSWEWSGFPEPRNRFDPASGMFRTRYAADTLHGAARERYSGTGRYVPTDHAGEHLVQLVATQPLKVLDLRTESNLDALGADDRINTGKEDAVLGACHRLADCCRLWWPDLDGLIYRPRTTPESSANLAFFGSEAFRFTSRRLDSCTAELDELVLRHEFTIGFAY
ncbi:MAG TPA: RES domain-containing protein [Acidimicrobiales bacterium]|nr:RES domain-containing protein [Acidimicrobiales bacterium]